MKNRLTHLAALVAELKDIPDWADYPENKIDCVCDKDEYNKIIKRIGQVIESGLREVE